jgi:KipI family sensor histidine kinase inhibitor
MEAESRVKAVGEYSWLLTFDDEEERRANQRARAAADLIRGLSPDGLVDVIPAARTLFVAGGPTFDAGVLVGLEAVRLPGSAAEPRLHGIRIVPDGEDVVAVSSALGLSPKAFWEWFLAPTYTVGFLGFSPGFAYLYGLPRGLRRPRRKAPRVSVPARSLAMAGPYVGIYPAAMPGGWNLLGTADAALFDAERRPPTLFEPGDSVRFFL